MNDYVIRDARVEDAGRLLEIYSYYITDTAVSFEYEVPSVEEFAERIRRISARYPYLVCELDGEIVGYVYAGRYNPREAYAWTVTTSIYLDKDHRRQGVGTLLYAELEKRLGAMGIVNLLAGVTFCDKEDEYLSHDSYAFHIKSGYTEVANMKAVGKKFDRWYDLVWFQKRLAEIILPIILAAIMIQGCGTASSVDEPVVEVVDTEAGFSSDDAVSTDSTGDTAYIADSTGDTPGDEEPVSAQEQDSISLTPEVIVDMETYEYKWEKAEGHKYVDTTGCATLILDKNHDLYYFGAESPAPVVIMQDVKAFSLDDDSDTMGYTSPVAAILTNDGNMYVCGDASWGSAGDVNVLATPPEDGKVSFLEPILVNKGVLDINVDFRQMTCVTDDNKLYRSPSPYDMSDRPENPTDVAAGEDISEYFLESTNLSFVLDHTVSMGCGRSFFISVLEDGSVWSCFLPQNEDDVQYAEGYGEVMGDGSTELISGRPVCVFPAGTVF